jgi:transposase
MNKEMRVDIFRHLRHSVRRKSPEKCRTISLFLLHYNAAAHRSVLIKDFLATNNVTALEHPTYSPDLAEADFLPDPSTDLSTSVMLLTGMRR